MNAKMKAPEGCTGCSCGGESFDVVEGFVTVPLSSASELMGHGFIVADYEPTEADIAAQAAKAQADEEEAAKAKEAEEVAAAAKKLLDEKKAPAVLMAEEEVEKAKSALFDAGNIDDKPALAQILDQKIAALDALKNG